MGKPDSWTEISLWIIFSSIPVLPALLLWAIHLDDKNIKPPTLL